MNVGERIKFHRKAKKLTQKQLGELCGMQDSRIRQYELELGKPKLETLQRIADALEVSINELVPGLGAQFDAKFPDAKAKLDSDNAFEQYLSSIDFTIEHLGGVSFDEDGEDFAECRHILTQGDFSVTLTDEQYKNFQRDAKHIIQSYARLDDADKARILERLDMLLENIKSLS